MTPDNSTLILAESYASRLTAFDIADGGSLSNRRVWAELDRGAPDGICLDAENAVWYGDVANKRCVRVREGGAPGDRPRPRLLHLHARGADERTLFMLAADWGGAATMADGARTGQVLTAEAPAPGVGWP